MEIESLVATAPTERIDIAFHGKRSNHGRLGDSIDDFLAYAT
jgi:hypothetical protein